MNRKAVADVVSIIGGIMSIVIGSLQIVSIVKEMKKRPALPETTEQEVQE